jgi:hypothetical protein
MEKSELADVYHFTLFKGMKCGMVLLPCGSHSATNMLTSHIRFLQKFANWVM